MSWGRAEALEAKSSDVSNWTLLGGSWRNLGELPAALL